MRMGQAVGGALGLLMAIGIAGVSAIGIAGPAMAQGKVVIGLQPTLDVIPVLVAKEEGFLAKRGVDAEIQMGPGSVQVSGLVADSLQIGNPTMPQVLQAVDSGLDLTIIADSNLMAAEADEFKAVIRSGLDLTRPQDYVGRKVGVNTLGAFLHVLFVAWLERGGVDPGQVTFVEVPFPNMADVLRQGTVDAVMTVEPFAARMVQAGTGHATDDFLRDFPAGMPVAVYIARRDWVQAHRPQVEGFRGALQEALDFTAKNPDKAREDALKYLKLPPAVLAAMKMPVMVVDIPPAGLAEWVKVMKAQGLVHGDIDVKKLLER